MNRVHEILVEVVLASVLAAKKKFGLGGASCYYQTFVRKRFPSIEASV